MSKLNNFKLAEKRKARTRVGRGNGSKGSGAAERRDEGQCGWLVLGLVASLIWLIN